MNQGKYLQKSFSNPTGNVIACFKRYWTDFDIWFFSLTILVLQVGLFRRLDEWICWIDHHALYIWLGFKKIFKESLVRLLLIDFKFVSKIGIHVKVFKLKCICHAVVQMILFLFSILLPPFEIDLNHNFFQSYMCKGKLLGFFPYHFAFIRTWIEFNSSFRSTKKFKDAHFQLYKIGNIYYKKRWQIRNI